MLNDARLRAAKPRAKAYKLTDSHRLYALITPAGGKLWRWNYTYDGKQKSLALGAYPMVTLVDARAKRDVALGVLAEGRDPAVARKLQVDANLEAGRQTFEVVARAWHERSKPQWAVVHADDVIRSLERDVFPTIGAIPISELTPPIILEVLTAIEERGAIETAKRLRQRISATFAYGIAKGVCEKDPSERLGVVLKPLRKGRQPAITDLTRLRKMVADAEEDFARPVTRLALRLLALTSVRPNEIRGAAWSEFEELNGPEPLWRIPAARMKGDLDRKAEIDGDHLVPLAPESVAVLRALWPLTGSGQLVFPSNRLASRPMSSNAIGYLLNRAGYHGHHVPHGFRAAFSTIMNEWAKVNGRTDDREVIDLMLAHVPTNKVEGAYNRAMYLSRRRELARVWAKMLVEGLAAPHHLVELPSKGCGTPPRRTPPPVGPDFRFPDLQAAR